MMKKAVFLGSVVGLLSVMPAFAQTAPQPDAAETATNDGDIIVTARRTAERLRDVPLAVSAVSGDDLAERGARTITDISRMTPGLSITPPTTDPFSPVISIRGQVQNDVSLISLDSSTGFYLDDFYLARPSALIAYGSFDLDRVEVSRGPQGTLFGRNATGGNVRYITHKPDGELGGYFRAQIGNLHTRELEGAINLPIIGEKLALRVAGLGHWDHGYGKSLTTGQRSNDLHNTALRASLTAKPVDGVTIDLSYHNFDGNGGNQTSRITSTTSAALIATYPTQVAQATALKYDTISTLDRFAKSTNDVYIAAVTVDISDDVQLSAHYGHFDISLSQATDFIPLGVISSRTFSAVNNKQDSAEVRLSANLFDSKLALQGGLYYLDEKGNTVVRSQSLPTNLGGNGVIAVPYNTGHNRSKAAFAQGTLELTDQLKLTLGGRYTDEKRETTNNTQIIPLATITPANPNGTSICALAQPAQDPRAAALLIGPCLYGKTINNGYFSYLASVDFKPSPDHLLYLKTARSYRAGGTSPRGANPDAFKEFFPEKVTEYEAGYKGRLFERLNLNIALYYDQRRNGQASGIIIGAGGNAVTTIVNRVNANIFGQELEASLKLTDFLSIDGNFSHIGKRIPYVPQTRYALGVSAHTPVSAGTLRGRVDYSWQSEFDTLPLGCTASGDVRVVCPSYNRNINTTDSYGLVNARLTYEFDKPEIQVSLYVRNLTDKYYDTWKPDSRTSGMTQAFVGAPRTYGVEMRYQF